jgi:hypothetical protein
MYDPPDLAQPKVIKACDVTLTIGGDPVVRIESDFSRTETARRLLAAVAFLQAAPEMWNGK